MRTAGPGGNLLRQKNVGGEDRLLANPNPGALQGRRLKRKSERVLHRKTKKISNHRRPRTVID